MEFGEAFWKAVVGRVALAVLVVLILVAFLAVVVWSCLRLDMCVT